MSGKLRAAPRRGKAGAAIERREEEEVEVTLVRLNMGRGGWFEPVYPEVTYAPGKMMKEREEAVRAVIGVMETLGETEGVSHRDIVALGSKMRKLERTMAPVEEHVSLLKKYVVVRFPGDREPTREEVGEWKALHQRVEEGEEGEEASEENGE